MLARLGLPHGCQLPTEAGGFTFWAEAGDSTQLPLSFHQLPSVQFVANIKINMPWNSTIEKNIFLGVFRDF